MDSQTFIIEAAAWVLAAVILVTLIINKYDIKWRDIGKPRGYEKL